jgi:hypothetical protein
MVLWFFRRLNQLLGFCCCFGYCKKKGEVVGCLLVPIFVSSSKEDRDRSIVPVKR